MATMEWWDDLWLNEGFANTVMYFAVDNIYPEWKVVREFCNIYTYLYVPNNMKHLTYL